MSGTEVSIDVSKARVAETVVLAMGGVGDGEGVSSYDIAQAISEIFLGLLIVAKFIDMPFGSFQNMRDAAEVKDPNGISIVDRAAKSLHDQMVKPDDGAIDDVTIAEAATRADDEALALAEAEVEASHFSETTQKN